MESNLAFSETIDETKKEKKKKGARSFHLCRAESFLKALRHVAQSEKKSKWVPRARKVLLWSVKTALWEET